MKCFNIANILLFWNFVFIDQTTVLNQTSKYLFWHIIIHQSALKYQQCCDLHDLGVNNNQGLIYNSEPAKGTTQHYNLTNSSECLHSYAQS